ncbi:hypothetical protein DVA81_19455, partial [Acinetobacter baumannii]
MIELRGNILCWNWICWKNRRHVTGISELGRSGLETWTEIINISTNLLLPKKGEAILTAFFQTLGTLQIRIEYVLT